MLVVVSDRFVDKIIIVEIQIIILEIAIIKIKIIIIITIKIDKVDFVAVVLAAANSDFAA